MTLKKILQMRLSSLNKYLTFFILIFASSPLISEEAVDIWKKKDYEDQ